MSEAYIIDGRGIAAEVRKHITQRVAEITAIQGFPPHLAVILVGDDPSSQIYIRAKQRALAEVGIRSSDHRFATHTSQAMLLDYIDRLNGTSEVQGILVQLPLPPSIDAQAVFTSIAPHKDVDGFHPFNVGLLAMGRPRIVPCTPLGCLLLLRRVIGDLSGCCAVIIGRSWSVGRPMAQLLLLKDCTVTLTHSRTKDVAALCRGADILVAAAGRPRLVRGSWIKPGAVILDVGITRMPTDDVKGKNHLIGDVAFSEACTVAAAITPVPGGVGPMTVACLVVNTLTLACHALGLDPPQQAIP